MTKHLLTAAALALIAASAQAQSSVTAYGFLDLAVGKNIGSTEKELIDSAGSRLGFKGSEALGDGLTANFEIETRFDPSTGQSSTPFWKGRSYVGLSGGFGAVKLGRWWTQSFLYGQFQANPFGYATIAGNNGAVGVGSWWNDNSITYNYDAGGFSFGAQVAQAPAGAPKRSYNVGVSYSGGGLWVGVSHEDPGNANDVWDQATVTYELSSIKLSVGLGQGRNTADQPVKNLILGGTLSMGQGKLITSFEQHRVAGTTVESRVAAGYQYDLSKRTKLYATVANDSKATTSKTGYDLGILHSF